MLNGKLISLREMEVRDLDLVFLWNEQDEVYLFKGRYKFASQEDLKKSKRLINPTLKAYKNQGQILSRGTCE